MINQRWLFMSHDVPATERRITVRLLSYWERLRKGHLMPTEQDIDPDDIKDLWDYCFLIHVKDLSTQDYHYTHLGQAIAAAYRGGIEEDAEEQIVSLNASKLLGHYQQIMETRKPLVDEGEFTNLYNEVVKYRQCLLPLGEDGEVQAIFGGMRFKVFAAKRS